MGTCAILPSVYIPCTWPLRTCFAERIADEATPAFIAAFAFTRERSFIQWLD
jgi:hypothetical protein